MHSAIRRYKVLDVDTLVRKVQKEFVERVRQVDGFVGYYVVDGGDGYVASVTVTESEDGLEQAADLAREWVQESAGGLVQGPPEVTTGAVRVRAQRDDEEQREVEEDGE